MINTRGTYSPCHYYFPALLLVQLSYARKMKSNTKLVFLVIFQMRPTKWDLRNTKRGIVFVYSYQQILVASIWFHYISNLCVCQFIFFFAIVKTYALY